MDDVIYRAHLTELERRTSLLEAKLEQRVAEVKADILMDYHEGCTAGLDHCNRVSVAALALRALIF